MFWALEVIWELGGRISVCRIDLLLGKIFGIAQVGVSQVGTLQVCPSQVGPIQVGPLQVGPLQVGPPK